MKKVVSKQMQDKFKGERVLVFSRATLDELGSFQGISEDTSRFMDVILDKSNNRFCKYHQNYD